MGLSASHYSRVNHRPCTLLSATSSNRPHEMSEGASDPRKIIGHVGGDHARAHHVEDDLVLGDALRNIQHEEEGKQLGIAVLAERAEV